MKAILFALLLPTAAAAEFSVVSDRSTFVGLMQEGQLKHSLFPIRLRVTPDGLIDGEAVGSTVTGSWQWDNGYFCRTMAWGDREIPFNCQLVEVDGRKVRFTENQGQGRAATFRID